jgi:hypothetical protein
MTRIVVPLNPDELGGASVTTDHGFDIRADRDKTVLLELRSVPTEIEWFGDFELMYCQRENDPDVFKVIRKATDEERRAYRVPLWLQ